MFGTPEIILIVIVVILLFGANKIPEIARSLGKATGEFKKGKNEIENEIRDIGNSIKEGKSNEDTSSRIKKIATDIGISTEGKSDEQLVDEIRKKSNK